MSAPTLGAILSAADERAAERAAARRARRDAVAADVAAAARIRAMSQSMGDDPTGAALLAAWESGTRGAGALAAAAESGTRSARSMSGTMDRAARRQADRERAIVDAGQYVVREDRTETIGRILRVAESGANGTHVERARVSVHRLPLSSGRCGCRVARCKGGADVATAAADILAAWERGAIGPEILSVHRERGGRAIVVRVLDDCTPRAMALAADGPTEQPDHDAASCTVNGCRRCGRPYDARQGAPDGIGPLATMRTVKGRTRGHVARADRRPNERTDRRPADLGKGRRSSDGQVAILRESSLLTMSDPTRHHRVGRLSYAAAAVPMSAAAPSLAVLLVDAVTESSVGRRGYRVAWEHVNALPMVRRTLLASAAADVAERFSFSPDRLAHWAARAGLSADALAVAWAAAGPDRTDAYGALRPTYRARKRAAAARSVPPMVRRPANPISVRFVRPFGPAY